MRKRKSLRYAAIIITICLAFNTGNIGNIFAKASADTKNTVKMSAGFHNTASSMSDGRYAVEVELSGGSGKASVVSPTLMTVKDNQCYAQITWSSSNYDYMVVSGETYYNESEENANSSFIIPIMAFDEAIPVTADTLAMGTPHEIQYTLYFYSDSIDPESSLPQEGAKRVLAMAAVIIVVGGILNHFANQKRKRDYSKD